MSDALLPRRMFKEGDKPKGQKINLYQQVYLIKELLEVLDEAEVKKLREAGFSGLFDIPTKPYFSRTFILMLLSRLLEVETKKELRFVFASVVCLVALWYDVAGLLSELEKLEYPTLLLHGKKLVVDFIADIIDFIEV